MQFTRGQEERCGDAATCCLDLDVMGRAIWQEGADVIAGAVAEGAGDVRHAFREVWPASRRKPGLLVLDNQELAFEPDSSVAFLALKVVDACCWPAAAGGGWRWH